MAFTLGVVVGHTLDDAGAKALTAPQEYFFNDAMAQDMLGFAADQFATGAHAVGVQIFRRNGIGVKGAYKAADDADVDLTVELHYNSFSDRSVSGTETLSSGTAGSMAFAKLVQASHCVLLGRGGNSRGVKIRNRENQDRGWFSLVAGRAPAIIIEPGFGSHAGDDKLLKDNQFEIGRAVVRCAHDYAKGQ